MAAFPRRDERGSIPLAMLLSVIALGLGAVLASVVSSSIDATRADVHRVQALNAAHAGLDVAVAHIVDAGGSAPVLPCGDAVQGSAGVDGAGDYRASITYHSVDPDRLASPAAAVACTDLTTPRRYAVVSSEGSSGPRGATRTLTATYRMPSVNEPDVPGGLIRLYGSPPLCIAAATDPVPRTDDVLRVVACAPNAVNQAFVYRPDLSLALESDISPTGLCIDETDPVAVKLQPCVALKPAQQWRYDGWRNFTDAAGRCLSNVGGILKLGTSCHLAPDRVQTWEPDSGVGAGAAGAVGTAQLVNGDRAGRCLNAATATVRVHPCTQTALVATTPVAERWQFTSIGGPSGGSVDLTDLGALTTAGGTGTLSYGVAAGRRCLTAPVGTTSVTVDACTGGSQQLWTVTGHAATWAASFTVQDRQGRCLASSAQPIDAYATMPVLAACDGTRSQKWNVIPGAFAPKLRSVGEQ